MSAPTSRSLGSPFPAVPGPTTTTRVNSPHATTSPSSLHPARHVIVNAASSVIPSGSRPANSVAWEGAHTARWRGRAVARGGTGAGWPSLAQVCALCRRVLAASPLAAAPCGVTAVSHLHIELRANVGHTRTQHRPTGSPGAAGAPRFTPRDENGTTVCRVSVHVTTNMNMSGMSVAALRRGTTSSSDSAVPLSPAGPPPTSHSPSSPAIVSVAIARSHDGFVPRGSEVNEAILHADIPILRISPGTVSPSYNLGGSNDLEGEAVAFFLGLLPSPLTPSCPFAYECPFPHSSAPPLLPPPKPWDDACAEAVKQ